MARRPRRRVIGLVAAACLVLAAAACSGDGASATSTTEPTMTATTASPATMTTVPIPTGQQAIDLQARAIARAWPGPRLCMDSDHTPAELRTALAPLYDEIVYTEVNAQLTPAIGWDFCTLVSAVTPRRYRAEVVGVDVWITRGFLNGIAETYLFRWDGSAWVDSTPEETGVTVTSSVS